MPPLIMTLGAVCGEMTLGAPDWTCCSAELQLAKSIGFDELLGEQPQQQNPTGSVNFRIDVYLFWGLINSTIGLWDNGRSESSASHKFLSYGGREQP